MEHSKTPWRVSDKSKRVVCYGHDEVVINSEANARRIVACVNACEGLSTDLLEKAAITAAHIEARERLSFCTQQIEAERDELQSQLEAERASLLAENQRKQQLEQQVEELVGVLERLCTHKPRTSAEIDADWIAARAVIKKVRGWE